MEQRPRHARLGTHTSAEEDVLLWVILRVKPPLLASFPPARVIDISALLRETPKLVGNSPLISNIRLSPA